MLKIHRLSDFKHTWMCLAFFNEIPNASSWSCSAQLKMWQRSHRVNREITFSRQKKENEQMIGHFIYENFVSC